MILAAESSRPELGEKLEEFVHRVLREAIIEGKISPGDRLNERQIAAELGVSRDPVRQALRRLESEGFVRTIPRWGTHVRTLSAEEMLQSFELRQAIEVCAARRAAVSMAGSALEELRKIAESFRNVPKEPMASRIRAVKATDLRFHITLLRRCGNSVMSDLFDAFVPFLAFHFGYAGPEVKAVDEKQGADLEFQVRRHLDYVTAIGTRDSARAEEEARGHIAKKWKMFNDEFARLHPEAVSRPSVRPFLFELSLRKNNMAADSGRLGGQ